MLSLYTVLPVQLLFIHLSLGIEVVYEVNCDLVPPSVEPLC